MLLFLAATGLAADSACRVPGYREIRQRASLSLRTNLLPELVRIRQVPTGPDSRLRREETAVYALGGSQASMNEKFRVAAGILRDGLAAKILVLSVPGLTEYSRVLGRRMTNEEWIYMELEEEGVGADAVETVRIPKEFFGTLGEARAIPEMVVKKGYRRLILVSELHHSRRVMESFRRVGRNLPLEMFLYATGHVVGSRELLTEYGKLLVYEFLLLPGG